MFVQRREEEPFRRMLFLEVHVRSEKVVSVKAKGRTATRCGGVISMRVVPVVVVNITVHVTS